MHPELFGQVGISLLLGLLIGLQRQRTESSIGGIRTFPLIAAFGTMCGWLAQQHGGWIVAAGLLAVAALLVISNFMLARSGNSDAGQTSEIAALLLFGIGAYLADGELPVAVALAGVIAVLLHFKDPLHAFAARIGERDVTAIMQFVLITMVILPVLPNDYLEVRLTFGQGDDDRELALRSVGTAWARRQVSLMHAIAPWSEAVSEAAPGDAPC